MPQLINRTNNQPLRGTLKPSQGVKSNGSLKPTQGAKNNGSLKPTQSLKGNAALKPVCSNAQKVKNLVNPQDRVALKDVVSRNVNQKSAEKKAKNLENAKRPSLKPKVNDENATKKGFSKTVEDKKPAKVSKPGLKIEKQSKATTKETKTSTASTKAAASSITNNTNVDFVIFCDENDQMAITAVAKESSENEQVKAEVVVVDKENMQVLEKKKQVLTERVSVSLKDGSQGNLKQLAQKEAKRVQEHVNIKQHATIVEDVIMDEDMGDESLVIDSLKIDESMLDVDFTLDESGIDEVDKENDPSLMSVDESMMSTFAPSECSMAAFKLETCDAYSEDILGYMLERERKFMADVMYMSKQPEVNIKMRSMLVDWLVDVSLEYKLESETVFLAVNYIDRFLSSLTISLPNFQLLGTAALFIASKYEEIYPPDMAEFIYITDDAYTKPQMLSMEKLLLKSIAFEVSVPTPLYFLKKFMCDLSLPEYVKHFAEYLCFLSLLQTDPFLMFTASDIAICSILLSVHTFGIEELLFMEDFKTLAKRHLYRGPNNELSDEKANLMRQNCLDALYQMHKISAAYPQQAVYTKYSTEQYFSVSLTELAEHPPQLLKML